MGSFLFQLDNLQLCQDQKGFSKDIIHMKSCCFPPKSWQELGVSNKVPSSTTSGLGQCIALQDASRMQKETNVPFPCSLFQLPLEAFAVRELQLLASTGSCMYIYCCSKNSYFKECILKSTNIGNLNIENIIANEEGSKRRGWRTQGLPALPRSTYCIPKRAGNH